MDLWIRSQDRQELMVVSRYLHIQETSVNPHSHKWGILLDGGRYIGEYNSEKRALEILDEIQSKIKQQFICKIHPVVHPLDVKRIQEELSKAYNGDFILEPSQMDIEPINSQILIYEMPEK